MPKESSTRELSDAALEMIADRFRILSEASRLKLIHALESGEKNVSELMRASGLAQANVSRQLQTLAKAGILSRRRDGIKVIYGIADPGIFTLCNQVCGSLQRRLAQHAKSFAEL